MLILLTLIILICFKTLNENMNNLVSLCQMFRKKLTLWQKTTCSDEFIQKWIETSIRLRLREVNNFKAFHKLMKNYFTFLKAHNSVIGKSILIFNRILSLQIEIKKKIFFKVSIKNFVQKIFDYDKIENMVLSHLVNCLSVNDHEISEDALNSRIQNFDEIADKIKDLNLIKTLVRISPANTFLYYFIKTEASSFGVILNQEKKTLNL